MKKYYAVFTKMGGAVEVVFPDIDDCFAFGFDLADAYSMAFDKLFHRLPEIEMEQVRKPTSYEDLKVKYPSEDQIILPFVVDLNKFQM